MKVIGVYKLDPAMDWQPIPSEAFDNEKNLSYERVQMSLLAAGITYFLFTIIKENKNNG